MSDSRIDGGELDALSGAELLQLATTRLLAECPTELSEQESLDRTRTIITCSERLQAARLVAIRDVDRRELFALDAAGSTRGWLRTQLGGERGQLTDARRLGQRPVVEAALAGGHVAGRSAEQLCAVLDKVPGEVDEEQLRGVIVDGIGGLLQTYTGGLVPDDALTPDLVAARAEALDVLESCCADRTSSPAARLEPALVLLARRVSSGHLGPALRQLVEALLPDGSDGLDRDPYFFDLRELLDGDVDIRGHLSAEVGHGLAAEIERRVAQARASEKDATAKQDQPDVQPPSLFEPEAAGDDEVDPEDEDEVDVEGEVDSTNSAAEDDPTAASADDSDSDSEARAGAAADAPQADGDRDGDAHDPHAAWDAALASRSEIRRPDPAFEPAGHGAARQHPGTPISTGRRRHDALAQLLHDLADVEPGSGQPTPPRLTVFAGLDAVERRLGALPGTLTTASGRAAFLSSEQLQRLSCYSDVDVVILDALGNPVGASHTRRNLTRRERRALRVQWGSTCAVAGCPNTVTVPHHVEPYWQSRRTRLRDMIPACEHCNNDLHLGHRTLRLRDGRLIDEHGWVTLAAAA